MTRPLKVLHLLDVLRFSGAETCLKVVGPMWADHQVSCDVLATGPELGEYAPHLFAAGYRTGHLPLHPAGQYFSRLWRLIRAEQYDVVHNHVEEANFFVDLLVRAQRRGAVQHLHTVFEFEGTLRLERVMQRRLMRMAGVTFLSCSPDVMANEADRFANPTQLLLNWADLLHYRAPTAADRERARARFGLTPDSFVLTSVANCHEIKNHSTIITALRQLPSHVVLLHVGETAVTAQEQEEAAALGLDDRVLFVGHQPDPLPALHAADCYIQPSLHEGMSIAAIEALATDLPAVLTDVPGLRHLRQYGAPIRWAPRPDVPSVVAAVLSVIEDGRPPGDAAGVRAAVDPKRAVAELADTYRRLAHGGEVL